jgi:hypothetical protein
MKFKFSELTAGHVELINHKVRSADYYFTDSLSALSRRFLSIFLEPAVDIWDDQVFVEQYYRISEDTDRTKTTQEIETQIARDYLMLEREPRLVLLELYIQATSDLDKINGYVVDIEKKLANIEGEFPAKNSSEANYYRKRLEFYKDRNLEAKQEIVEFLTSKIRKYASQRTTNRSARVFAAFQDVPYAFARIRTGYRHFQNLYDTASYSIVLNKFGDVCSMRKMKEIDEAYNDDRDGFFEFARAFVIEGISGKSVTDQIRELLTSNHNLNARRSTIESILKHYEAKDYVSFVNMVPLQIEGIFNDICIEMQIAPSTLSGASINAKLDRLKSKLRYLPYYEYYAFTFPVIRNAVAHGTILEGDLEREAIMLMLDFLPVCKMTLLDDIPLNRSLGFLRDFEVSPVDYDELIGWVEYVSLTPPSFYGLQSSFESALKALSSDEFWNYLEDKMRSDSSAEKSPYFILGNQLVKSGLGKERGIIFKEKHKKPILEHIKKQAQQTKALRAKFLGNRSLDNLREMINSW